MQGFIVKGLGSSILDNRIVWMNTSQVTGQIVLRELRPHMHAAHIPMFWHIKENPYLSMSGNGRP
jgi:hypothetical protein